MEHIYDRYRTSGSGDSLGLYDNFFGKITPVEGMLWQNFQLAGIYLSIIALIMAFLLAIIYANGKSQKAAESRQNIVKVMGIIVALFGTTGIICLIVGMAIRR